MFEGNGNFFGNGEFIQNIFPTPPTDLSASSISYSATVINFTKPTTPTNGYYVYNNGVQLTSYVGYTNSITLSGLTELTSYTITIASYNNYGISTKSNSLSFTVPLTSTISASGSTITTSGSNTIYTFSTVGTGSSFQVQRNSVPAAKILIVGGGGGGGADTGGGGGGGGIIDLSTINISAGTYSITVGAGSPSTYTYGYNGKKSSFGTYIAYGGGGGTNAHYNDRDTTDASLVGSGGGKAGGNISGTITSTLYTPSQGYSGGINTETNINSSAGGGGGGGGGPGGNGYGYLISSGVPDNTNYVYPNNIPYVGISGPGDLVNGVMYGGIAGKGGAPYFSSITGTSQPYSPGGGGGVWNPGYGASGGYGNYGQGTVKTTSGWSNANIYGGGGGGAGQGGQGVGYQGIVIISIPTASIANP